MFLGQCFRGPGTCSNCSGESNFIILTVPCLEQGRQAIPWVLISGDRSSPQMPRDLETLDFVFHVIGPREAESKPPGAKPRASGAWILPRDVFDRSAVLVDFGVPAKLFAHLGSLLSHIAFSLGITVTKSSQNGEPRPGKTSSHCLPCQGCRAPSLPTTNLPTPHADVDYNYGQLQFGCYGNVHGGLVAIFHPKAPVSTGLEESPKGGQGGGCRIPQPTKPQLREKVPLSLLEQWGGAGGHT